MVANIIQRDQIGAQSPTWGSDCLKDRKWLLNQLQEARRLLDLVESAPDEWFEEYREFCSQSDRRAEQGEK